MKTVNIGLIGFGTVGVGFVKILKEKENLLKEKLGFKLKLRRIADLSIAEERPVKVDRRILTTDVDSLLNDPDLDIVVELIGGIEPARSYILKAIENGKQVVTANKALLAHHGEEIFEAAKRKGVEIGFEASVCGGIPILKALRESLVGSRIESILGIVNGTSNYILSKMTSEQRDFQDVLEEAKEKGYAEENPQLDIDGTDSAHKLVILARVAFGANVELRDVYKEGISHITLKDIQYAKEFGYVVKLLAIGKEVDGELELRVHPTLISTSHLLASVNGAYNACYVVGDAIGEAMFYGEGAGGLPTGGAVVADVVELARGLQGEFPTLLSFGRERKRIRPVEEIETERYIRFMVVDQPGVLSKISGILGKNRISIASVIQKERGKVVPIVMMAHRAKERDFQNAIKEIDKLPVVKAKAVSIRIEEI